MIRVGIVGYGFAGRGFHAYLISRVPQLQLVAVASRSAERRQTAEADYGVATFATLDEMLAGAPVDLVVIATPHHTHAALACQAMAAGRHVVVDKVMALSVAEADTMLAARDRSGVALSVFHNRRWDWDYLTVRKVLAEGWLGEPYLFETAILRNRPPRGWRADLDAGGGILFDWGAHLVDQALQIVPGPVATVQCDIQRRRWGAAAGSYVRLLLRFASGVLYGIEIGNLAQLEKPRWLILGEDGALVKYGLDPQEPAMLQGNIDAAAEPPEDRFRVRASLGGLTTEMVVESVRGNWTSYYQNVADALAGRAELAIRPEEARRALTIFEAARESAASDGQAIRPLEG
ncbi:MAG: Gfo/Idh/MocA family oxidoreductase [Chloroflexi bacterium]|nr:Gfo/Idh/MocA family oxidoreductase [Chloroflexota bacterium]